MLKIISILVLIGAFCSCGLRFEPAVTKEETVQNRKKIIENYLKNAYADSAVKYKSLFYGEMVVVKPESYKVLDSLYEVKFKNEQKGFLDKRLEEIIGNQRNVIIQDAHKLRYIENHVYAISNETDSEINFCEIILNGKNEVTDFQINQQNTIPIEFLDLYQIYLSNESFLNPGYLAANREQSFYTEYAAQLNSIPLDKQNDFLIHQLKIMYIAQKLRSIDNELLIKELSVSQILNRKYKAEKDKFVSIDGLFINGALSHYLILLETENKKFLVKYSPFIELIDYQIME